MNQVVSLVENGVGAALHIPSYETRGAIQATLYNKLFNGDYHIKQIELEMEVDTVTAKRQNISISC